MLVTPIQPKIKALKISYYAPHCTNECAKETERMKEKEKNDIFTKQHEVILTIMSYCLFNNMLVY